VGDDWGRLRSGPCVRARGGVRAVPISISAHLVRPASGRSAVGEREREKEDDRAAGREMRGVRSFRYQIPRQDTRLR